MMKSSMLMLMLMLMLPMMIPQLRKVFRALFIARLLGRALVMPKLMCQYDFYWDEGRLKDGRVLDADGPPPGPFACPLDHVFYLESLENHHDFVESSFLENPHVPVDAIESTAILSPPDDTMNSTELIDAYYLAHNRSSILHFTGDIDLYFDDIEYVKSSMIPISTYLIHSANLMKDKGGNLPIGLG